MGRADEALKSLERGAELIPSDPEAQSALGVALIATGRSAEAVDRLKRAAELDRDNPERLTNLGTAYMMRGRVTEAIRAYERAVAARPERPARARRPRHRGACRQSSGQGPPAPAPRRRACPRPRDFSLESRLRLPARRKARHGDRDLSPRARQGRKARLSVDQSRHRARTEGPARRGGARIQKSARARSERSACQGEHPGARRAPKRRTEEVAIAAFRCATSRTEKVAVTPRRSKRAARAGQGLPPVGSDHMVFIWPRFSCRFPTGC